MSEQAHPSLAGIYNGETFAQAAFEETPALHPSLKQLAMLAVRQTMGNNRVVDGAWAISSMLEPWADAVEESTASDETTHQILDPHKERRLKFLSRIFPDVIFDDPAHPDIASSIVTYARVADITSWRERRVMKPYALFALNRSGPWSNEALRDTVGVSSHQANSFLTRLELAAVAAREATGELIVKRDSRAGAMEDAIPAFANLARKPRKQYRSASRQRTQLAPIELRREAMLQAVEDPGPAETPFERIESVTYINEKKTAIAPWHSQLEAIADGGWNVHRANVILEKSTSTGQRLQAEDTQQLCWFLAEFIFYFSHVGNKLSASGTLYTGSVPVHVRIASLLAYIQKRPLRDISADYYDNVSEAAVCNKIYAIADTARFFEPRLSSAIANHPDDQSRQYPPVRKYKRTQRTPTPIKATEPAPLRPTPQHSPPIKRPALTPVAATVASADKLPTQPVLRTTVAQHFTTKKNAAVGLPEDTVQVLRAAYYQYPLSGLSSAERDLVHRLINGQSVEHLYNVRGRSDSHDQIIKEIDILLAKIGG